MLPGIRRSSSVNGTPTAVDRERSRPCYVDLLEQESPSERYIRRDIARTYPTHELFAKREGMGQEVLFNVIKAYSNYDTEVGYCQGSPFIVGLLLMHMPEEEAFNTFSLLMREYKLRGLFKPSMEDLPLRLYQLDMLLQSHFPELFQHFASIGVDSSSYASQWFLTLFASSLPLPLVFRIMDIFLLDGIITVFRVALGLLGNSHEHLLLNNFEEVMKFLTKGGLAERYKDSPDELIDAIFATTNVTPKRLQRLEKDYQTLKQREAEEESELAKVRRRLKAVEEENEALKEKVGGGQVSCENISHKQTILLRLLLAFLVQTDEGPGAGEQIAG